MLLSTRVHKKARDPKDWPGLHLDQVRKDGRERLVKRSDIVQNLTNLNPSPKKNQGNNNKKRTGILNCKIHRHMAIR